MRIHNPVVAGGHGEDGDQGDVVGAEVVGRLLAEEADPHDGVYSVVRARVTRRRESVLRAREPSCTHYEQQRSSD